MLFNEKKDYRQKLYDKRQKSKRIERNKNAKNYVIKTKLHNSNLSFNEKVKDIRFNLIESGREVASVKVGKEFPSLKKYKNKSENLSVSTYINYHGDDFDIEKMVLMYYNKYNVEMIYHGCVYKSYFLTPFYLFSDKKIKVLTDLSFDDFLNTIDFSFEKNRNLFKNIKCKIKRLGYEKTTAWDVIDKIKKKNIFGMELSDSEKEILRLYDITKESNFYGKVETITKGKCKIRSLLNFYKNEYNSGGNPDDSNQYDILTGKKDLFSVWEYVY